MKFKKYLFTLLMIPFFSVTVYPDIDTQNTSEQSGLTVPINKREILHIPEGTELRGVLDEDAGGTHYLTREPVPWLEGEYLVNDAENKVAWLEDYAGNDISGFNGPITTIDSRFGVYNMTSNKTGKRILYCRSGEFGQDIAENAEIIPIEFKDFTIIAAGVPVWDEETYSSNMDITDPSKTVYFDTDGNKIEDVYKYIADKGAKPEDGTYFDLHTPGIGSRGLERPFLPRDEKLTMGVPDKYPFAEVTNCQEMENFGQRIVDFVVYSSKGRKTSGTVIEDETGKDQMEFINNQEFGGFSVSIFSEKYGLYYVHHQADSYQGDLSRSSVLNKDFKGLGIESMYGPTCYDFGDFCLICFDSTDRSYYEKNTYYDIDGNAIKNVDQYLKERGKTMSDAIYTYACGNNRYCRDTISVLQNPYESEKPYENLPRVGRVIVGNGTEEVWIENNSGKDLTGIINGKVEMLHYGCNVYKITYFDGSIELMNSAFELFGKGSFDVNVLDFDGKFVIAESTNGISPYDTAQTVYYKPDGTLVTDITEYTGKDVSEGKISTDTTIWGGYAGSFNSYYNGTKKIDLKIYPKRTHIKGTDIYIAGQQGSMWIENAEGKDLEGWGHPLKDIKPISSENLTFLITDEINGSEVNYLIQLYNDEVYGLRYNPLGETEKYLKCLQYHGFYIYAGSNEDVSPLDTDKNTYYSLYRDGKLEKMNDVNECLAAEGLRLSDFSPVSKSEPETETVEITQQEIAAQEQMYLDKIHAENNPTGSQTGATVSFSSAQ